MSLIKTNFSRSEIIESVHFAKVLVRNKKNETLISSGNENDLVYPRSSIKIFQAIPLMECKAHEKYQLNSKILALACSSHRGEDYHIKELGNWINKIKISEKVLKCGTHLPLNINANKEFLIEKKKINQLYNNCAGKHLAMITSCLINGYSTKNYLEFNHPHQIKIRNIFEKFTGKKIQIDKYGIDGCSAPQYAFKLKDINKMLSNLLKSYNNNFEYKNEVGHLIDSILKNPKYIGGSDSLDSTIMKISNKKIFCKGGAEGVFLFTELKKSITGVIKIVDGNERAIPSLIYNLFKKLNIMNSYELKLFKKA